MTVKGKLFNSALSLILRRRVIKAWDSSKIAVINSSGTIYRCPYCGGGDSEQISRWRISDHYGLFDDDADRMGTIHVMNAPRIVPDVIVSKARTLTKSWLSGRAFVEYRRCRSCDLIYQNYPHDAEAGLNYYKYYYRAECEARDSKTGQLVYGRDDKRWVEQQRLIGRYFLEATGLKQGSMVVDVGCAEGWVCRYLEDRGMKACGIEPSESMVNYARKQLGLNSVVCGKYDVSSYGEGTFDGIISHHVAEHVFDVDGFFKALASHIKSDGYLLLQVPCADNYLSQRDREEVLQGGHVYCFSERFLSAILKKYSFEVVEQKMTPRDLNTLDRQCVGSWGTSVWGDDPGGISILARKKESTAEAVRTEA